MLLAAEGAGTFGAGTVLPLLALVAVGYLIGERAFRRFDRERFFTAVLVLVAVTGAASIVAGLSLNRPCMRPSQMRTCVRHDRVRPLPPVRAPGRPRGQARAALRARRAGAGGGPRADGGRGVGAGRGVRRRARDAGGRGDVALPGPAARAARSRGGALALEHRARPARGDRRRGRVRPRGRRLLPFRPACAASTAGTCPVCSRRRAGRSVRARAWERRPAASRPMPPPCRHGRAIAAGRPRVRLGAPSIPATPMAGGSSSRRPGCATSWHRCPSPCFARASSSRRFPRSSSSSASAPWARSLRSPRVRSPSASATRGC